MMNVLTILLGFVAGGVGYLVINFWMNPLLRYLDIKHQVTSDLVFYANVIDASMLYEEMEERLKERKERNRHNAAEIRASSYRLPGWYRKHLKRVGEDPIGASKALIGLSNSSKSVDADPFVTKLRNCLRIPESIED